MVDNSQNCLSMVKLFFKMPMMFINFAIDISGLSRGYFLLSKSDIHPGLIFSLSLNLSPMYLQNNSSKISTFIQSWERQLMTRVEVDCSTSDRSGVIVRLAVSHLLSLL